MKVTLSCPTLYDSMGCSPWNSLGQTTGVGSLSLLQGIFPTQGLNPGFPHLQVDSLPLSHKGSPRISEWVAYPVPSRFSWPRNWTGVSCIAGRFFTSWAIREASMDSTAAAAESLQSCLTLCDPIDGSLPGSSIHGIFQAGVLEWGAIAFSEYGA